MNKHKIKGIVYGAAIAALYVVLTEASNFFGLASGVIQLRLSEALYALALFTPYAVPGLFIGCLLANIFVGSIAVDIVFGSLATLVGTACVYTFRNHKYASMLCPVIANAVAVPPILAYAYKFAGSIWYFTIMVSIGEFLSCFVIGCLLAKILNKYKKLIFR